MICNQQEIASILSVTERTVRDWQKITPSIPFNKIHGTKVEYDVSEVVAWYADYKLAQFKATLSLSPEDKRLADAREALARAELREIELATTKGELLKVKDVEIEWSSLIMMIRQSILNLPHVLATTIDDGLTYQQKKDKIQKEADVILKSLSDGK